VIAARPDPRGGPSVDPIALAFPDGARRRDRGWQRLDQVLARLLRRLDPR
jgi:hypothetical protein